MKEGSLLGVQSSLSSFGHVAVGANTDLEALGFRSDRILMKVHGWHGEMDLNTPFAAHGKVIGQLLPNSVA